MYQDALKEHGGQPGRYLSVEAAEYLSGLPRGWTSPRIGACDPSMVQAENEAQLGFYP